MPCGDALGPLPLAIEGPLVPCGDALGPLPLAMEGPLVPCSDALVPLPSARGFLRIPVPPDEEESVEKETFLVEGAMEA